MNDLAPHLQQIPRQQPLWLALSGGLDSMVLLHLLHRNGYAFRALHVNHQLSANADSWQTHCEKACAALGIALSVCRVEVKLAGAGVEDAARQARYQAFAELMADNELILTAHHQDDQAETLMLRLLRGAGVAGLAAMPQQRTLAVGQMLRPLLGVTRAELEAYAQAHRLTWVEDESNQYQHYDRNFLRSSITPLLAQRWPGFARRFAQSAQHCAQANELLVELAQIDLTQCRRRNCRLGVCLDWPSLSNLSVARAHNALRHWLAVQQLVLSSAQFAQLVEQLRHAADDAQLLLRVGAFELRRYQGWLYQLPLLTAEPTVEALEIRPNQTLIFADGQVWLEHCAGGLQLPECGYWLLRTRREGERAQPATRHKSQSLKKLLQEVELEPWLRPRLPMLCHPQTPHALLAVGDLWLERSAVTEPVHGFRLRWQFT